MPKKPTGKPAKGMDPMHDPKTMGGGKKKGC